MRYSTARVSEEGVVLYEGHRRRLCASREDEAAFEGWALGAAPGVYALQLEGGQLSAEVRAASRLQDGMPTRWLPTPMQGVRGAFPKPAPPSAYASVRSDGVATLLTDPAGEFIFESCVAAVLAWDGAGLVAVPEEAPRVASLAEGCVLAALPHRRAPLAVASSWPLLLLNAVAVAAPQASGRAPFPTGVRAEVEDCLRSSARRPTVRR